MKLRKRVLFIFAAMVALCLGCGLAAAEGAVPRAFMELPDNIQFENATFYPVWDEMQIADSSVRVLEGAELEAFRQKAPVPYNVELPVLSYEKGDFTFGIQWKAAPVVSMEFDKRRMRLVFMDIDMRDTSVFTVALGKSEEYSETDVGVLLANIPFKAPQAPFMTLWVALELKAEAGCKAELTYEITNQRHIAYRNGELSATADMVDQSANVVIEGSLGISVTPKLILTLTDWLDVLEAGLSLQNTFTGTLKQQLLTDGPACIEGTHKTAMEVYIQAGLLNWRKADALGLINNDKKQEEFLDSLPVAKFSHSWDEGSCGFHLEDFKLVPKCTQETDAVCTLMDGDVVIDQIACIQEMRLEEPRTPEKEGYTFDCWMYTSPESRTYRWNFAHDKVPSETFVLKAQWRAAPTPTPEPFVTPEPTLRPTLAPGAGTGTSNPSFSTTVGTDGMVQEAYPGMSFVQLNGAEARAHVSSGAGPGAVRVPATVQLVIGYDEELQQQIYGTFQVTALDFFDQSGTITALYAPSVTHVVSVTGSALLSVNLPNAISLDMACFAPKYTDVEHVNRSLKYVNLPEITSIPRATFSGCPALIEALVPKAQLIDGMAFYECASLTKANYPLATSVGDYAFNGCSSLAHVNLPKAETFDYSSFRNCTALRELTLESAALIDGNAFVGCVSLEKLSLPNIDYIEGTFPLVNLREISAPKATSIASSALSGKPLTSVSFPNVIAVGAYAFQGCSSLKSVDMPSLTTMDTNAFAGCTSLTSLNIPNTEFIGSSAFYECTALKSLSLPNVNQIGEFAFYNCTSLQSLSLPLLRDIARNTFQNCESLTKVDGEKVYSVAEYAFNNCSALTSVSLPTAISLGDYAFAGCMNLEEAIVTTVQTIGRSAFEDCVKIKELALNTTHTISYQALASCTQLKTLNLPVIRRIEGNALPQLERLTLGASLEYMDYNVVSYIPEIRVNALNPNWMTNTPRTDGPQTVFCRTGSSVATYYQTLLERGYDINLFYSDQSFVVKFDSNGGSSVANVPGGPLETIKEPKEPTRVGYVFTGWQFTDAQGETRLWNFQTDVMRSNEITLKAKWLAVNNQYQTGNQDNVLYHMDDTLTQFEIPASITTLLAGSVGQRLKSLHIPAWVTTIEPGAFVNAQALTSITIDAANPAYCVIDGALYTKDGAVLLAHPGASADWELSLPASITAIAPDAFACSAKLQSIRFPHSITGVTHKDFTACDALQVIHGPADDEALQDLAQLLSVGYNMINLTLVLDSNDADAALTVTARYGEALSSEVNVLFIMVSNNLDKADASRWLLGWAETPGGPMIDPSAYQVQDQPLTLYAVFGSEPFITMPVSGGLQITGCSLNRSSVEIPATLGGLPIVAIADGAFSATVEQLVGARNSAAEHYAQKHGLLFQPRMRSINLVDKEIGLANILLAEEGALIPMPTAQRDGYHLSGWKRNNKPWDFATQVMPAHDITLNPVWTLATTDNAFLWEERDGGAVVLGTVAPQYTMTIPATLGGLPVTGIANGAFERSEKLEVLVLPDSVTFIGDRAFAQCARLFEAKLGANLQTLGAGAFSGCAVLQKINLPDGLKQIGDNCFNGCTRLSALHIGPAVTAIGQRALLNCLALSTLTIDANNTAYQLKDGLLLSDGGARLTASVPPLVPAALTIPNGVTAIDDYALFASTVESVTLPESLTAIGKHAFAACTSLTAIELPKKLTTLGDYAFFGCTKLLNVKAYAAIAKIGVSPFNVGGIVFTCEADSLLGEWAESQGYTVHFLQPKRMLLPAALRQIDAQTFAGSAAEWVVVPYGCVSIGNEAFRGCSLLERIEIPETVATFGSNVFADCPHVVLYVSRDSAAHRYAVENQLAVVIVD